MRRELHLSIHFIDLCKSDYPARDLLDEPPVASAPPASARQFTPWQVGDKLTVQGQDYYIDGSVQSQWLKQEDTLAQQAAGRQAGSGQKVWLKQCQVGRAHEAALALKRDLEKEGRLLQELRREGQRDFPQPLGNESSSQSAVLVFEMLAGRSLAATFATTPKPLDHQATRRLLSGRHTLVQMLHALHKKNCAHRMLTPETLLIQPGSHKIILAHVGLAACTVRPGEGPERYQAPEQLRGLPVPNHLTDIYQLGALFYHVLMGQLMTEASVDQSGLPPALDALLRKAAAPIPRNRWPDVHAFSHALRQLGY